MLCMRNYQPKTEKEEISKLEVEEKKEWKIKRYCLIILIKFIQPKWELIEFKRNLKIDTADVVEYCKNKVLDENCHIYKQGKNWYCEVENIKITINSYSYTIITAHIVK